MPTISLIYLLIYFYFYLMFLQHIIYSLKSDGKAAVVVPTGFITANSGIPLKIRKKLIDEKMLSGVVSMPSNIFANTGTNVSIVFIDKTNKNDVVLIDASNIGQEITVGDYKKTVLSHEEEKKIINTFNDRVVVDDFSVVVSHEDISAKNYSLSAGQFFEIKIEYTDITKQEFDVKIGEITEKLDDLFTDSKNTEISIKSQLSKLQFNEQ